MFQNAAVLLSFQIIISLLSPFIDRGKRIFTKFEQNFQFTHLIV
jgi:hypothetical protein